MKCLNIQAVLPLLFLWVAADVHGSTDISKPVQEAYEGWQPGIQCWTFKNDTMFEAIDKVKALNLNWIEAFPGQLISPEQKDRNFLPDLWE